MPSYIQICGIILGMITIGYLGDRIGRKWGSVTTVSIMGVRFRTSCNLRHNACDVVTARPDICCWRRKRVSVAGLHACTAVRNPSHVDKGAGQVFVLQYVWGCAMCALWQPLCRSQL